MVIKNCKTCKKEIKTFPCLALRKKYCSKSCAGKFKKGKDNPFFGKHHTLATKLHLSIVMAGKQTKENHHNWKGGKPKCLDCGKRVSSYIAKRCITCNGKFFSGENCTFFGKHHTNELRKEMSEKMLKMPREISPRWIDGRSSTKEYKRFYSRRNKYLRKSAEGIHTLEEWENLKRLYGYMCLCCKRVEPEIKLTEDHIIPLSRGGSNFIENIQPLCHSCNSRKSIKTISYLPEQILFN